MPHRTFISFIWPSALAMMLFIALPIVSVAVQSLFIAHEQVIETVENCGPFGCKTVEAVNAEATAQLRADEPLGRFNGVGTYTNRNHLAFAEIGTAWSESSGLGDFADRVLDAANAWSRHVDTADALAGLPDTALELARQTAQQRGLDGYLLTLEMPSYLPVMTYAEDEELRREVYTAFNTENQHAIGAITAGQLLAT